MEEEKFSELVLSFSRSGNQYTLGMRFLKAGEDAPREIDAQEVRIDPGALDEFDPEAYGKTLTGQVLARRNCAPPWGNGWRSQPGRRCASR
ncbi:MAG: hypothetical protein CVU44_02515 [Chloroflexi bacterium HGW-Chloroflexi-6]|nr:MAG: hypothetical protein CVU44_02515 [Chloroflexi bacterium HGW-Chloroflexi-6]